MFLHTTHVQALPDYRLHLVFNNGVTGEVSLLNELWGEVFEPLKNEQLFATARHDEEMGTVVWANGADFAPRIFDESYANTIPKGSMRPFKGVEIDSFHTKGIFTKFQDENFFNQAYVDCDTVCWPGDLDIAPETLFDRGSPALLEPPFWRIAPVNVHYRMTENQHASTA